MGDEQDRALEVAQQAFEPHDGAEIEVVGRLVEQQHVGRGHQRHGQRHALLHTARQGAHQHVAGQVEPVERGVDLVLHAPAVGGVELDLQIVHAVHQRVVVALAELAGELLVLGQHGGLLAHAGGDRVEHRHGRVEGRLLLDVGDFQALLLDQQAVIELELARNDLQQRGLAGAVAADQADALRLQGKIPRDRAARRGRTRVAPTRGK